MASTLTAAVGTVICGIAAAYAFLFTALWLTQDRQEPPLVLSTIPFVSPLLGSESFPVILELMEIC